MKAFGMIRTERKVTGAFRVLSAVLVFAVLLSFLYVFRPVRFPFYDAGQYSGVFEMDHNRSIEQPFRTDKSLTGIAFKIATYHEEIESGRLSVRILDAESASLICEKDFPAEQLIDNSLLTIPADLSAGDYIISFSLADFDEHKPFAVYKSSVYDLPKCRTADEVYDFSVYLELGKTGVPIETTRNHAVQAFRFSTILTIAVILASIVITAVIRKKKTGLNRFAMVRAAFAMAALIIIGVLLNSVLSETVLSGGAQFLRSNRELFYLLVFFLAVFVFLLAEDFPFSAYLLLLCAGLILIFEDISYSIIDEEAHTEVIQYIIRTLHFPRISENYEAVQGPVYYFVLALLSGWLPYQYIYLAGRVFGAICLVLFGWISGKTVRLIAEAGTIRVPKGLLNACILVFIMNPHILIRFTRVSNEALMSVLVAFAIFEAVRLMLEGFDSRKATLCTVLCAVAFLTKSTSVFVFGLVFLACAYYHKWKAFFQQTGLYLLLLAPWVINNYRIYGHLTAMQGHLDFVLPIVNPDMNVPDIWQSLVGFFSRYFCSGECGTWYDYPVLDGFLNPLCLLLLEAALIISLSWLTGFIRKKLHFTYDLQEKRKVLFLSFTALPVVSMVMHAVQSLMTMNNSLEQNRYVLMLNGVFCCLLLFGFSRFSEKAKKGFTILICVFYAFFGLSLICGYTETLIGRI